MNAPLHRTSCPRWLSTRGACDCEPFGGQGTKTSLFDLSRLDRAACVVRDAGCLRSPAPALPADRIAELAALGRRPGDRRENPAEFLVEIDRRNLATRFGRRSTDPKGTA